MFGGAGCASALNTSNQVRALMVERWPWAFTPRTSMRSRPLHIDVRTGWSLRPHDGTLRFGLLYHAIGDAVGHRLSGLEFRE